MWRNRDRLGLEASPAPCVLILAGGAGARIGGAKPDRTLAGHRLIDHAVQIARRNGRRVAVGLRALEQVQVDGVHVLLDVSDIDGPLASLAAGLVWAESCGAEVLLTLPCDAPFLPRDLAESASENKRRCCGLTRESRPIAPVVGDVAHACDCPSADVSVERATILDRVGA